jgi:intracellular multiplication protein IcmT
MKKNRYKDILFMAHWRDSARSVRLFFLDFRACFPLLILLFHIRLWTFLLAMIATVFFAALERYGFSLIVFLRWFRSFIAGSRKIAQPWWKR